MKYNQLGKTDLQVSELSFGAGPLGNIYGGIDAEVGARAVHAAIDNGINFIDSSPYYGITLSETRLGEALKGGYREKVLLATKCGRYDFADFDFSYKRVIASLEESLKRLQTDWLDLFQVHDIEFEDRQIILNEAIPAMQQLKADGKVRYIGITGYPLALLHDIAQQVEIDTILSYCHYNLMNTTLVDVLLPVVSAKNLGLINASILHMGMLADAGAPDWHPAPQFVHDTAQKAAEEAKKHGTNISKLAIQFAFQNSPAHTTLIGMKTEKEVRYNLSIYNAEIDKEALEAVQTVISTAKNVTWVSGREENYEPNAYPHRQHEQD